MGTTRKLVIQQWVTVDNIAAEAGRRALGRLSRRDRDT
jgi:hypothetical protein